MPKKVINETVERTPSPNPNVAKMARRRRYRPEGIENMPDDIPTKPRIEFADPSTYPASIGISPVAQSIAPIFGIYTVRDDMPEELVHPYQAGIDYMLDLRSATVAQRNEIVNTFTSMCLLRAAGQLSNSVSPAERSAPLSSVYELEGTYALPIRCNAALATIGKVRTRAGDIVPKSPHHQATKWIDRALHLLGTSDVNYRGKEPVYVDIDDSVSGPLAAARNHLVTRSANDVEYTIRPPRVEDAGRVYQPPPIRLNLPYPRFAQDQTLADFLERYQDLIEITNEDRAAMAILSVPPRDWVLPATTWTNDRGAQRTMAHALDVFHYVPVAPRLKTWFVQSFSEHGKKLRKVSAEISRVYDVMERVSFTEFGSPAILVQMDSDRPIQENRSAVAPFPISDADAIFGMGLRGSTSVELKGASTRLTSSQLPKVIVGHFSDNDSTLAKQRT